MSQDGCEKEGRRRRPLGSDRPCIDTGDAITIVRSASSPADLFHLMHHPTPGVRHAAVCALDGVALSRATAAAAAEADKGNETLQAQSLRDVTDDRPGLERTHAARWASEGAIPGARAAGDREGSISPTPSRRHVSAMLMSTWGAMEAVSEEEEEYDADETGGGGGENDSGDGCDVPLPRRARRSGAATFAKDDENGNGKWERGSSKSPPPLPTGLSRSGPELWRSERPDFVGRTGSFTGSNGASCQTLAVDAGGAPGDAHNAEVPLSPRPVTTSASQATISTSRSISEALIASLENLKECDPSPAVRRAAYRQMSQLGSQGSPEKKK